MLLINLVYLFLCSSFFPLLNNSSTALYYVRSSWFSSSLKVFFTFVPNFASAPVWEETFPQKVCKPFTPKGLFQNVFSPGVCFLAEEPKGLMVVLPPASRGVCFLALQPKSLMVVPPPASPFPSFCPFDPLPFLFTLISRAKAFASTAKVLYQKLQVEGLNPNYLRFVLNMVFGFIAVYTFNMYHKKIIKLFV
ncbi:hypothetical protein EDC94DRAFT_596663 [Helicostylum pulchrum]|nr:hypothetical protein EDC94DRAFT_596663 [Helicostylum pulchrum]